MDTQGKLPFSYDMVGVHSHSNKDITNPLEEFAKNVPHNTEVVVDFRFFGYNPRNATGYESEKYSGTALIPRTDRKPEHRY
jgi:hypothetical protein